MNIHTQAVHAGDRQKADTAIPVTTPIVPASSFLYEDIETTDRVFADEIAGYAYARYDNPTNHALEQLLTKLENGAGALATSSGMLAMQVAIQAALTDRRRSVVVASALYGATVKLVMNVFEPSGVEVRWVDICDLPAVEAAIADAKPGCVVMETISNPLLRVGALDRIAAAVKTVDAALVVDNTFATPLLVRPLELGANLVVHSLTKYLSGHGDVLGGAIISDAAHLPVLRALARTTGPNLGAFEAYLAMRGIKTFPLRMERQCANAAEIAAWLGKHPRVSRVHWAGNPEHPDRETIDRIFASPHRGAIVSFSVAGAGREQIFAFLNRLKLVVKATSLGDVHSMILYPAMSSHRDISPKQRQRLGIGDDLVRLSVGIEHAGDIVSDMEQALA
ncbi:MAG: PLP-dependent aspartate aminotransferase family protein [Bryobacteraceae bacterium]